MNRNMWKKKYTLWGENGKGNNPKGKFAREKLVRNYGVIWREKRERERCQSDEVKS